MSEIIKTINIGEIEISATIAGKPVQLIAGENLTVTLNGNITIDLNEKESE